jgi:small subunit ribosomal protein S16e
MTSTGEKKQVQTFGRKKNATAVAVTTNGSGFIKVNGKALGLVEPETLRMKVYEPILLIGGNRFKDLNIRVRVKGGGQSNQIFAIRQAISKSVIAYY